MIAIVIVSYNARPDLERCLDALRTSPPAMPHVVVVVDNASKDGSAEAARQRVGVQVIDAGSNVGFAAACNIGIRATTNPYILLLNSDTVVPAGALERLMGILQSRPEAAVVGPRLVDASGQAELSFGSMISPLNELRQRRLVKAQNRRDPEAVRQIDARTRHEQWPDWVSGACLLVSRADAEAVGLLDERYFMYTEDVDFCAAIRARGRRILFTPDVEVVHVRGRSAASDPTAVKAAYVRSHLAFYRKHHPLLAPLVWLYRRFPGVAV